MTKHAYGNVVDLGHAFFNHNNGETCYTRSAWFKKNTFGSYGTSIGYIYEGKKGKVLLADNSFYSHTTCKHYGALVSACPFDVINVPFRYGYNTSNWSKKEVLKFIAENFTRDFEREMGDKKTYTRAKDREYALTLLANANRFVVATGTRIKGLAKFNKFLSKALSAESIKKASERVRKIAQAKAEKTKKEIADFKKSISNKPLLDLVDDYMFNWDYYHTHEKERELFINMFGVPSPSFVKLLKDTNEITTTKHITMPVSAITTALRAWKHKHNIVGQSVGGYTILANNDKFVKIGCHTIPVANIQALCDVLL